VFINVTHSQIPLRVGRIRAPKTPGARGPIPALPCSAKGINGTTFGGEPYPLNPEATVDGPSSASLKPFLNKLWTIDPLRDCNVERGYLKEDGKKREIGCGLPFKHLLTRRPPSFGLRITTLVSRFN
jgi:hypothetical protein